MNDATKAPHLFKIGSTLCRLHSSSDGLFAPDAKIGSHGIQIAEPHACVYGTGISDDFWQSISLESLQSGLLGRIIIFEACPCTKRGKGNRLVPIPPNVLKAAKFWSKVKPVMVTSGTNLIPVTDPVVVFERTPLAEQHLDECYDRWHAEAQAANGPKSALAARKSDRAAKLALLVAISRYLDPASETKFEITHDDAVIATELADFLESRMLARVDDHVSRNKNEAVSKEIYRFIKQRRKWVSLSELAVSHRHITARERREVLEDLILAELLERKGNGHGGWKYRALK